MLDTDAGVTRRAIPPLRLFFIQTNRALEPFVFVLIFSHYRVVLIFINIASVPGTVNEILQIVIC